MTYKDVAHYLLTRGWISNEMIVDGDLVLLDASRRNANFKVLSELGPNYFVKQETRVGAGAGHQLGSVAYEASIYELLATVYGERAVFRCLPTCHAYDPGEQLLLLEALVGWVTLTDHYFRRRRFSLSIGARLGAALAGFHELTSHEQQRIERAVGASGEPPWALSLTEPDHRLSLSASLANIELLRILQQSEDLVAAFERLRRQWRNTALIHGDAKWDNCLVPARAGSHPAPGLKIVDWELARLGDPCWDVGTVFSGHLTAWLSSVPISGVDPPDRFLEFAHFPLARMQPALRTFWRVYCQRMKIPSADVGDWLVRATSFAAVRLVQTAFEHLQAEAEPTASTVLLLQLCSNIVARPLEAAVQLLGLPLPEHVHEDLALF